MNERMYKVLVTELNMSQFPLISIPITYEVTLLSDTVRVLGKFSEPNAKAANKAAFAFNSDTILIARSGLGASLGGGLRFVLPSLSFCH